MSELGAHQPTHEYQRFLQSLPNEWGRAELRTLGTVVGGGTPSRGVPSFWQGNIPWVTPGEISGNAGKFLYNTSERISASGLSGSGANLLPAGSLLVTTRATLGARVINAVAMATNQGFKSIVFKQAADSGFYFHLFQRMKSELVRRASGTTFLEISASEFASIEVPLPDQDEKRVITSVIDTLDTAIHETEALIAKLKAVKQGLLHDLLTRGVDANGELRPPQPEAPHLYKQSPLGWIPNDWDCVPLQKKLQRLTYGFTNPMPTADEGPWMLTAADIFGGHVEYSTARKTSSRAFHRLSAKSRPEVGDVLVTKDGTLGRVAVVDRPGVCVNQSVAVMSPLRIEDSIYLSTFLQSSAGQDRMMADAGGSTIRHLYISKLADMTVAWPNDGEAKQLATCVSALDTRLEVEKRVAQKLTNQKAGLMDDLLTGRVRVTPLLDD